MNFSAKNYDDLGRRLGVSRRRAKQMAEEALVNEPEKLALFDAMDKLSRISQKAAAKARRLSKR